MSQTDTPTAFFRELMDQSQSLSAANGYAEAFWKSQAAVAEHMQSFMDDWYSRRREAASEASECCSRMMQGENAAEAWAQWTRAEMDRLSEDARAQAELTAALSNDAFKPFAAADQSKKAGRKKNGASASPAESRPRTARSSSSEASHPEA